MTGSNAFENATGNLKVIVSVFLNPDSITKILIHFNTLENEYTNYSFPKWTNI